jgi:hypothetical protein
MILLAFHLHLFETLDFFGAKTDLLLSGSLIFIFPSPNGLASALSEKEKGVEIVRNSI